jgi:hypothetical protein
MATIECSKRYYATPFPRTLNGHHIIHVHLYPQRPSESQLPANLENVLTRNPISLIAGNPQGGVPIASLLSERLTERPVNALALSLLLRPCMPIVYRASGL